MGQSPRSVGSRRGVRGRFGRAPANCPRIDTTSRADLAIVVGLIAPGWRRQTTTPGACRDPWPIASVTLCQVRPTPLPVIGNGVDRAASWGSLRSAELSSQFGACEARCRARPHRAGPGARVDHVLTDGELRPEARHRLRREARRWRCRQLGRIAAGVRQTAVARGVRRSRCVRSSRLRGGGGR
jgi:hypothetical protein